MKSVEALQSERDELYIKVEEFSSRMASWQSMEVEYKSYRKDVEVKLAKFVELDEDVFRLKAEIEELKMRNQRMQKRLAEKENEIKELESR